MRALVLICLLLPISAFGNIVLTDLEVGGGFIGSPWMIGSPLSPTAADAPTYAIAPPSNPSFAALLLGFRVSDVYVAMCCGLGEASTPPIAGLIYPAGLEIDLSWTDPVTGTPMSSIGYVVQNNSCCGGSMNIDSDVPDLETPVLLHAALTFWGTYERGQPYSESADGWFSLQDANTVPEPATWLPILGVLGLIAWRRPASRSHR